MQSSNRYLDGLDLKASPGPSPRKTLALWIVLILMFLAAYQLWVPDPRERPHVPAPVAAPARSTPIPVALLVGAGSLLFMGFYSRAARRPERKLAAAEFSLHEGRIDDAIALLRGLIEKNRVVRARALFLLGQCAERRGDFEEADAAYLAAWHPATHTKMAFAAPFVSLVDARRAFVCVAAGRLDEGEALLRKTPSADAHPAAVALRTRAEALLLARRGDHAGLHALLARESEGVEGELTVPDRLLLEALHAASSGEGRSAALGRVDPDERRWIVRAAPQTAGLWEVA